MGRLISGFHKVIGELAKAVYQWRPGIIFGEKYNHLAEFFNKYIICGDPEFLWEPYGLASAV